MAAALQDGGPDVDGPQILAYLRNTLKPAVQKTVEQNVETYRAWFQAFLRLL